MRVNPSKSVRLPKPFEKTCQGRNEEGFSIAVPIFVPKFLILARF